MAKRKQFTTKDLPPDCKGSLNFDFRRRRVWRFQAWMKCMKLFSDRASTRNAYFLGIPVPDNILSSTDKTHGCEWLCKFAREARKKDEESYLPKTLYHYITIIQRHIRQPTKSSVNLLTDPGFCNCKKNLCALPQVVPYWIWHNYQEDSRSELWRWDSTLHTQVLDPETL